MRKRLRDGYLFMLVGYMRVSSDSDRQSTDLQRDVLLSGGFWPKNPYINTLMIQRVLAQPHWQGRLTPRDDAALTPLIWEHVNPYGGFELDMNTRLALL
jgi:hypothetical protein